MGALQGLSPPNLGGRIAGAWRRPTPPAGPSWGTRPGGQSRMGRDQATHMTLGWGCADQGLSETSPKLEHLPMGARGESETQRSMCIQRPHHWHEVTGEAALWVCSNGVEVWGWKTAKTLKGRSVWRLGHDTRSQASSSVQARVAQKLFWVNVRRYPAHG